MDTSPYASRTISAGGRFAGRPRPPVTAARSGETLTRSPDEAVRIAEVLKALAHPVRLRIVAVLCQRESEFVNRIAEELELKQAIVSQQLGILRSRGLVESSRANGFAYYRLTEPRVRELLRCMEGCSTDHRHRAPR